MKSLSDEAAKVGRDFERGVDELIETFDRWFLVPMIFVIVFAVGWFGGNLLVWILKH